MDPWIRQGWGWGSRPTITLLCGLRAPIKGRLYHLGRFDEGKEIGKTVLIRINEHAKLSVFPVALSTKHSSMTQTSSKRLFSLLETFTFTLQWININRLSKSVLKSKVLLPRISENVFLFIGLLPLYGNSQILVIALSKIQECSQCFHDRKSANWKSFLNSKGKHTHLLPLSIFVNSSYLFWWKKGGFSLNRLFINVTEIGVGRGEAP